MSDPNCTEYQTGMSLKPLESVEEDGIFGENSCQVIIKLKPYVFDAIIIIIIETWSKHTKTLTITTK